jgi:hypothetical protein
MMESFNYLPNVKESREEVIKALMEKTGKTREQIESFLAVLGSGMVRRGWWDGDVLSEEEQERHVKIFIGEK